MKLFPPSLFFLLFLSFLTACGNPAVGPNPASRPPSPASASTATDRDTHIDARTGEEFTIYLSSNPTTGYQWQLDGALDESLLKLVGSTYRAQETGKAVVGAGGTEIWTFRALKPGQTTIKLKYIRPWEKDVAPVRTSMYTVLIQ